jgi:hypothetical protein
MLGRTRLVGATTVSEVLAEIRTVLGKTPDGGEEYLAEFPASSIGRRKVGQPCSPSRAAPSGTTRTEKCTTTTGQRA